jgi:hypothetical protein
MLCLLWVGLPAELRVLLPPFVMAAVVVVPPISVAAAFFLPLFILTPAFILPVFLGMLPFSGKPSFLCRASIGGTLALPPSLGLLFKNIPVFILFVHGRLLPSAMPSLK